MDVAANLILLPVLGPILGAILCLFFQTSLRLQRVVSGVFSLGMPVMGLFLLLLVRDQGVLTLRLGSWPDYFGIVLIVDQLSAVMILFAGCTQAATWGFFAARGVEVRRERYLLHPLFLVLCGGVNWAFVTGDIFNLFVSFEIILLASYVLISYGNERTQIRESVKFVTLNIVASTFFLATVAFAYGLFGTVNMADLAVRVAQAGHPPEATVLGTMFLIVFGIKAAVFPLFFWLPDAYPKAPPGIVAYFSGVLTKVGVYCLYRMFPLVFPDAEAFDSWFRPLLLVIAGTTMFIGVMGAFSQLTFRRILSFHIISQIGYMIFGLGIFTSLGLAFGIFYIFHNMVVKSSLLMVGDCVKVNEGTDELKKVTGLIHAYPGLAIVFLLAALSLAGIPPLSGFYGKFGFIFEGIREGHYITVAVSIVTGLFTLASMIKIWRYSFWGGRSRRTVTRPVNVGVIAATAGLVFVSVLIALASGWLMMVVVEAGEELLAREPYIRAVMGDRGLEALRAALAGGEGTALAEP